MCFKFSNKSQFNILTGLDGALNMSDKMEALSRGIAANTVPALWIAQMSTRIQEVYSLSNWYNESEGTPNLLEWI